MPSIIGTHRTSSFSPFMDDHLGGFPDFEAQFKFLHEEYFPGIAFGLVYLSEVKIWAFCKSLELVGFSGSTEGLRLLVQYRDRMCNWPTPQIREELDTFI